MLNKWDMEVVRKDAAFREVLMLLLYHQRTFTQDEAFDVLSKKFPKTWRSNIDFLRAVLKVASSSFTKRDRFELTDEAKQKLRALDTMTSSCGATSIRCWEGRRDAGATYCWYCGGLM